MFFLQKEQISTITVFVLGKPCKSFHILQLIIVFMSGPPPVSQILLFFRIFSIYFYHSYKQKVASLMLKSCLIGRVWISHSLFYQSFSPSSLSDSTIPGGWGRVTWTLDKKYSTTCFILYLWFRLLTSRNCNWHGSKLHIFTRYI